MRKLLHLLSVSEKEKKKMAEYSKETTVRNGGKYNFFYAVNIVLVTAAVIFITLFLLLADRPEVSETEKRKLSGLYCSAFPRRKIGLEIPEEI